ncbi:hypothetical protein AB0J40_08025 [Amycolatopsis sp. NPDC049691]|uniref:hypothetical protein n=1 Tax=Amycolatopsis sp. NPDC049691 TaxID=3155155 RepID=UPI003426DBA0
MLRPESFEPDDVLADGETAAGRLPFAQPVRDPIGPPQPTARDTGLETGYCAEIVALTYEAMGLLPRGRRPNWYDPGRFWSGDHLDLAGGAALGDEIAVRVPS